MGEVAKYLALGEQWSLSLAPGSRYSVGNSEVLQAKITQLPSGDTVLLLKGKSQGYSDLLVFEPNAPQKKWSFRVNSKKSQALQRDTESLWRGKEGGVRLQPHGESWVATGKGASLEDMNLLEALGEAKKGQKVLSIAQIDPKELDRAARAIQERLHKAEVGGLEVKILGNQLLVRGLVKDENEKKLVEILVKDIFARTVLQLELPFAEKKIWRFQVMIMELLKNEQKDFGFRWGEEIPGIFQLYKAFSKMNFSVEAALRFLENRGEMKLLSQPQIALNAESTAELKVGGEIPIPVRGRSYSAVQWKPYGLSLKLHIPGARSDRLRTHIQVEMTSLDQANAMEGVPATKVNRMETLVDLKPGKTIFLSGLMQSGESKNVKGIPGLAGIPILGELFQSKNFQENRSELVIALTAQELIP